MKVGDLVIINRSYSRKAIGKLAIIVERFCLWNATILIVDTGKREEYDIRKLEVVHESR